MSQLTNRNITKILIIILISLILNISIADERNVQAAQEKKNIVILLDNSGSMQNELGKLAKIATTMTIDRLKENEANIGIITFGEYVSTLQDIRNEQNFNNLKDELEKVQFDEEYTNMKDGLSEAINQIKDMNGSKSIIILSDGRETSRTGLASDHNKQLEGLADRAKELDIKINSIALADDVERDFLIKAATKTEGTFREGKTADKLFEALTSIVGAENDFITINNNINESNKKDKIKISEMITEVIINVAACDNKQPNINVKLDGKEIENYKKGDLYYVYRFENNSYGELEITKLDDSDTAIIVQLKSKAKLNISGAENNYLSVPVNIESNFNLTIDCVGEKIPEGSYIEREGAKLNHDGQIGIFKDSYIGKEAGENIIKYTAKDGNGGIIAIGEVIISINDYPPFDYGEDTTSELVKGDIFKVNIVPKDLTEVEELGGTLVIKQCGVSEEIPLTVNDNKLSGEKIISSTDDIEYYVYIRGKKVYDNSSFEYKMPSKCLEVNDKPIIYLQDIKSDKNIKINEKSKLQLEVIDNSIIPEKTVVDVYDKYSNKIGTFELDKDAKGEITVEITPIKETDKLTIYFKTQNGIEITDSIATDISVLSTWLFNYKEYIAPFIFKVIIVGIIIGILVSIYKLGNKLYIENIEDKVIEININYKNLSTGKMNCIEYTLSEEDNISYLNYKSATSMITLSNEYENPIGQFSFVNENKGFPEFIQGLLIILKKEGFIKVIYEESGQQEIYYYDEQIYGDVEYKDGIRIIYRNVKTNFEIEF